MDIASLGIRVQTQGIKEADKELQGLGNSGEKVAAQTAKVAPQMAKTALSARELQFATRQLPMQFTDIATSLQAGQRPLQVLLQQGGQLKDIFGGVGPALRAMGGYLVSLINPLTLTAAAIGLVAIAWKNAADEGDAFDRALILTGNQADLTTERLRDMASEIDKSTVATAGKASDALAAVAQTGKFTADQIQSIAEAAINLEAATGRAIQQTVKEFTELERDPVNAILKLNDAIGDGTNVTNFLTEAQIKAIEKFKEQGQEAKATAVAVEAYVDAINNRSGDVVANLNAWTSLWTSLKNGVLEAGDAVVDFMRDSAASQAMARSLQRAFLLPGGFVDPDKPNFNAVTGKVTGDAASFVDSQAWKDRKEAEAEFARLAETNLSKRERLEGEIKKIRELGAKAGLDELAIQKEINSARARFAESQPKGRTARSGGGRRAARALPDFTRDASQELERQLAIEERAKQAFLDRVAVLEGPLATAERDHQKRIAELNALALQSPEAQAGLTRALELEQKAHEENVKAIEATLNPLGLLLEDMAFELDLIGKSNAERAVMIELRRANIDAMSAEGQAAIATAKAFDEEAKNKQRAIDLMDDFRSGATNALTDIVTGAKSAKDAFKDFFDDLARRITQMIAEKWIERAFGAMGTSGGGTSGGNALAAIFGSLFGGGRAMGGPVSPNRLYEVGEGNKPELFQMQGRSFLIPGNQGNVTPINGGNTATQALSLTQIFQVQGAPDRRTREQMARTSGREARRGMTRTG